MLQLRRVLPLAFLAAACSAPGAAPQSDDGWRPLFSGPELEGWVSVNTAPSTWSLESGVLRCSGKPIGELRTTRMYQNFELELEWRHLVPAGNAGIFVWADDVTARGQPFIRGIEVQVLENAYGNTRSHTTHGDIFPIHGATMTPVNGRGGSRAFPTEERSRPAPEWNHYRITCVDGAITLAVNGAVVTRGEDSVPRKGYICLESEGGVVEYRGARIRELPGTPLPSEHVAVADRGYRCLYDGVSLDGWTVAAGPAERWQPADWVLRYAGQAEGAPGALATAEQLDDYGFLLDVRWGQPRAPLSLLLHGSRASALALDPGEPTLAPLLEAGWNRFEGTLRGARLVTTVNGRPWRSAELPDGAARPGPLRLEPAGPVELANPYVRALD